MPHVLKKVPNPKALWQRFRLATARAAARGFLSSVTSKLSCASLDGIPIYHQHDSFRDFVATAFDALKHADCLGYQRMKRGLAGVVELNGTPGREKYKAPYTVGFTIGVFFDEFTEAQRNSIGCQRYAATLAGFAFRRKTTSQMASQPGWAFNSLKTGRILKIARKRELRCCQLIGCEMKHVYNMERLIRNS
jgi:hypothetical protein